MRKLFNNTDYGLQKLQDQQKANVKTITKLEAMVESKKTMDELKKSVEEQNATIAKLEKALGV